jgi:hypothetical protein
VYQQVAPFLSNINRSDLIYTLCVSRYHVYMIYSFFSIYPKSLKSCSGSFHNSHYSEFQIPHFELARLGHFQWRFYHMISNSATSSSIEIKLWMKQHFSIDNFISQFFWLATIFKCYKVYWPNNQGVCHEVILSGDFIIRFLSLSHHQM